MPRNYVRWNANTWNTTWNTETWGIEEQAGGEGAERLLREMLSGHPGTWGIGSGFWMPGALDCGQCNSILWGWDWPKVNPIMASMRPNEAITAYIMVTCEGDPTTDPWPCPDDYCFDKCCALLALRYGPGPQLRIQMLGPYCGGSCALPTWTELKARERAEEYFSLHTIELEPYRIIGWMRMQNTRLYNFRFDGNHESGTVCSD